MARHIRQQDIAERIRAMAAYGLPQYQIATVEGMDEKTLRKYYQAEFDEGYIKANAQIGQSAYNQSIGRPAEYDVAGNKVRDEIPPDKSVTIFLCKARLGMKEVKAMEVAGPGGGPVQFAAIDFRNLSAEETRVVLTLLKKTKAGGAGLAPQP